MLGYHVDTPAGAGFFVLVRAILIWGWSVFLPCRGSGIIWERTQHFMLGYHVDTPVGAKFVVL